MAKTTKRQKAAERRARTAELAKARAAQQARAKRIRIAVYAVGSVAVGLLLIFFWSKTGSSDAATSKVDPKVQQAIADIPATTYDTVGAGTLTSKQLPYAIDGTNAGSKVEIRYVGAEYCPFCAAERWSLTAALSRFGTFTDLRSTKSSSKDVFPDARTVSYYKSKYSSDVVDFKAVELSDSNQKELEKLTGADKALFEKWNIAKYTEHPGAIPFLYVGGKYLTIGASYDTGLFKDLSQQQIVAAMSDANSKIAQQVTAMSNVWSAAICGVSGGKPASVCTSPGVKAAAELLAKGR